MRYIVKVKNKNTNIETIVYDGNREKMAKWKYKLYRRSEFVYPERVTTIEEKE